MRKFMYGLIILVGLALHLPSIAKSAPVYGPTKSNEHLWRIALEMSRDDSVLPQQVMIAILKSNPSAFNHSNVNGLKSGYVLNIPTKQSIRSVPRDTAILLVQKQNQQWEGDSVHPTKKSATKTTTKKHSSQSSTTNTHKQTKNKTTSSQPTTSTAEIVQKQTQTPTTSQTPAQNQTTSSQTNLSTSLNKIEDRLNSLIKSTENYQQQTDARLGNLERQYKKLSAALVNLKNNFRTVTSDIMQILSKSKQNNWSNYWIQIQDNIKKHGINLLIALGVLSFLSLLLIANRRRSRRRKAARIMSSRRQPELQPVKEEYDFINAEDGGTTRLDLARAYIDMGDFKAAEKILKDVLRKGDDTQKSEARDLLARIKV